MLQQQQRATIEVHLGVGDPGSPQAIASSLKVEQGVREEGEMGERTTHTRTHTLYIACTSLSCFLPGSGKKNLQCGIMTLQGKQ